MTHNVRVPAQYRQDYELAVNASGTLCWQCVRCQQLITRTVRAARAHSSHHVREALQLVLAAASK